MKGLKGIIIVSLVLVMGVTGHALAGRGNHHGYSNSATGTSTSGTGYGIHHAAGTALNIFDGEPVTVSGVVSAIAYYGQGLDIDTGEEVVTVYGMGPVWYWYQLGVDRPVVGDTITVDGYIVTFSDGSAQTIATNVLINGEDIALRDYDTGLPLWQGSRGGHHGDYGQGSGRGTGVCPWTQTTE
jgi:hypothetical protein